MTTIPDPPPPFSIVRATSADHELALDALERVSGRRVDRVALDAYLDDGTCYLLLAIQQGRPEGVLAGQVIRRAHEQRPQFLLYEIDVREASRRRGIARALIQQYGQEATSAGASEIWVLTNASNQAAMRLYEQCGMARPNPDDVMWVLPIESA